MKTTCHIACSGVHTSTSQMKMPFWKKKQTKKLKYHWWELPTSCHWIKDQDLDQFWISPKIYCFGQVLLTASFIKICPLFFCVTSMFESDPDSESRSRSLNLWISAWYFSSYWSFKNKKIIPSLCLTDSKKIKFHPNPFKTLWVMLVIIIFLCSNISKHSQHSQLASHLRKHACFL